MPKSAASAGWSHPKNAIWFWFCIGRKGISWGHGADVLWTCKDAVISDEKDKVSLVVRVERGESHCEDLPVDIVSVAHHPLKFGFQVLAVWWG